VTRITTSFLLDFEETVFKSGDSIHDAVRDSIDSNLPDLEPEQQADSDLNDFLDSLDIDRSMDFDDLDTEPFSPPSPNGDTEDFSPRSTRWSRMNGGDS